MEQHFSPIKDVSRLQAGDIIVVPSEVNRKRKHLHVSLGSLSKLGVSSGFTCRSKNRPEVVEKLLIEDTGKPKVLFVSSVNTGYVDGVERAMLPFIGNRVNEPPQLPTIAWGTIYELPYGTVATQFSRRFFTSHMMGNSQNVLFGKITNNLFFLNPKSYYHAASTKDECISEVFCSKHSNKEGHVTRMETEIPCLAVKNPEDKMSGEEISMFLTSSMIFDLCYADDGKPNEPVVATRKFFVEYAKRGAKFYRPSQKFLNVIAARNIAKLFDGYIAKCNEITTAAKFYQKNIEQGLKNVESKIKEATDIKAYLIKDWADATVDKQLKEIMG